ncbi:ANTAR domain-containing protein [Nocardioides solisilvae]|uniref:ANTAR domain-containing protein n=1 Tax=Nocardioides solisilvae TaxID=1542435 RepID=UPI000D74A682|nr:ANTAR domain-containing protein [Nocardioides solisilvae]
MPEQIPDDVSRALTALAEIVYDRPDYPDVYAAITRTALEVVPGCHHAAISVLVGGGELTAHGATSPLAQKIDDMEGELREGPCYDAIVEEAFQMESDLTDGCTWPELGRRVLAETPVRGMIGYRIRVGSRKAGALNIFSETPGALDERSASIGAVLAAFASIALGAAAHAQQAGTLREGLVSNRVIGKATGLLMAAHGISDEEAFQVLRRASQELNIKLGSVAQKVLDGQLEQVRRDQ